MSISVRGNDATPDVTTTNVTILNVTPIDVTKPNAMTNVTTSVTSQRRKMTHVTSLTHVTNRTLAKNLTHATSPTHGTSLTHAISPIDATRAKNQKSKMTSAGAEARNLDQNDTELTKKTTEERSVDPEVPKIEKGAEAKLKTIDGTSEIEASLWTERSVEILEAGIKKITGGAKNDLEASLFVGREARATKEVRPLAHVDLNL